MHMCDLRKSLVKDKLQDDSNLLSTQGIWVVLPQIWRLIVAVSRKVLSQEVA